MLELGDFVVAEPPRTLVAVEIAGLRLALTRTHASARARVTPFAGGVIAGLGAAAIALGAAGATPRVPAPTRALVSVTVPEPTPRRLVATSRAPQPGRTTRRSPIASPPATPFGAADAAHVARAMATGELQEWEDAAGLPRFLTAGPPRAVGGRTCRDLALLSRLPDGGSRVRSGVQCVAGAPEDGSGPVAPDADVNSASTSDGA